MAGSNLMSARFAMGISTGVPTVASRQSLRLRETADIVHCSPEVCRTAGLRRCATATVHSTSGPLSREAWLAGRDGKGKGKGGGKRLLAFTGVDERASGPLVSAEQAKSLSGFSGYSSFAVCTSVLPSLPSLTLWPSRSLLSGSWRLATSLHSPSHLHSARWLSFPIVHCRHCLLSPPAFLY